MFDVSDLCEGTLFEKNSRAEAIRVTCRSCEYKVEQDADGITFTLVT